MKANINSIVIYSILWITIVNQYKKKDAKIDMLCFMYYYLDRIFKSRKLDKTWRSR